MNFQYFKYPQTTAQKPIFIQRYGHLYSIRKIPDPPGKLEDTVNRARAAIKYLKGVAFGTEEEKQKFKHVFNPDLAKMLSSSFQSKYGKHGEKLIDFLGSGPTNENLIRAGVI